MVKKIRSTFVYYIIPKLTQVKKERKKSNNQILFALKKKILEEYKDLKKTISNRISGYSFFGQKTNL